MGNYVDGNLNKEETVTYSAKVSLWKYWLSFLVGGLFVLVALLGFAASVSAKGGTGSMLGTKFDAALLLVALVVLVWPLIARRSTELVITNKRLIAKFGVVSTQSVEIRLDRIESVRVNQSLIGRILTMATSSSQVRVQLSIRFQILQVQYNLERRSIAMEATPEVRGHSNQ